MKNFKEIIEKCLAGELSGTFVLRNGDECISSNFKKDQSLLTSFRYLENFYYSDNGHCYISTGYESKFDIVDFIPDIPEQIKINVPEGKVPVMEQTESGIVITWKDPELTYNQIYQSVYRNNKAISSLSNTVINSTNTRFLTKINVLRKLTNIRNYFEEPSGTESGFYIYKFNENEFKVASTAYPAIYANDVVAFAKREHAQAAINMLGDELKYLFEPW